MAQLLLDLLPTALSAAVGQQMLIRMVHLLAAARKPVQKGLWFWLGAFVYCLLISSVVLGLGSLTAGGGTQGEGTHPKPSWSLLLNLVLGLLFIVLAVRAARAQPNPEKAAKRSRRLATLASAGPLQVFAAGFTGQITLVGSLLLLVTALKQITDADLGIVLSSSALIVYLVLSFALYELPLLLYLATPQQAASIVDSTSRWLQDHNKAVTVLLNLFMAYLLLKAGLDGLLPR
jgi:hypothetical protein